MEVEGKRIDKNVPIPMFYQLKQIILADIKSGKYGVGDMIPTEAELSDIYDISRTTVRQAILELVQEGYLSRTKGKGTFVAKQKLSHRFIQTIESFQDEMNKLGVVPSTEVLCQTCVPASQEIANILGIRENEQVIYLHRKRMADGEAIVTIKTYLPYEECKFILDYDLEKESLYGILERNKDTEVCRVDRKIEASIADEYDAKFLEMKKGEAIHYFTSLGQSKSGKVIEYSKARYRGERSSFRVSIVVESKEL